MSRYPDKARGAGIKRTEKDIARTDAIFLDQLSSKYEGDDSAVANRKRREIEAAYHAAIVHLVAPHERSVTFIPNPSAFIPGDHGAKILADVCLDAIKMISDRDLTVLPFNVHSFIKCVFTAAALRLQMQGRSTNLLIHSGPVIKSIVTMHFATDAPRA